MNSTPRVRHIKRAILGYEYHSQVSKPHSNYTLFKTLKDTRYEMKVKACENERKGSQGGAPLQVKL